MVKENYQYYDVDGTSAPDLRHQMNRKGTKWHDGNVYAALTTWDIRYHYDLADEGGRYAVRSVTTDLDVTYHFPRRIVSGTASDAMAQPWGLYLEHLKTHEFGHKDIAVKAAAEINEALSTLGSFASASDLESRAKTVVETKLKNLKAAQIAYDEETHHGETQGAILE